MYKVLLIVLAMVIAVSLVNVFPVFAQDEEITLLTSSELDDVFGPIALYPDPLLAQILPASTFPDQLLQASMLISLKGGSKLIDDQDWDASVKAVAYYPSVIKLMVNDPDWSDAIGQAYINQPEDVMNSIQRLRGRAKLLGYLSSNEQQEVIYEPDYVRIIPAQPEYIYVPVYDPQIVYIERIPSYRTYTFFISFGTGYRIGSWLNRDCDWHRHNTYYHGWQGDNWIHRSRSHVVINNIYVNNYYYDNDRRYDRRVERNRFDDQRNRNYEHRTQGSYQKLAYKIPTRPDANIRPYDTWKKENEPKKSIVSQVMSKAAGKDKQISRPAVTTQQYKPANSVKKPTPSVITNKLDNNKPKVSAATAKPSVSANRAKPMQTYKPSAPRPVTDNNRAVPSETYKPKINNTTNKPAITNNRPQPADTYKPTAPPIAKNESMGNRANPTQTYKPSTPRPVTSNNRAVPIQTYKPKTNESINNRANSTNTYQPREETKNRPVTVDRSEQNIPSARENSSVSNRANPTETYKPRTDESISNRANPTNTYHPREETNNRPVTVNRTEQNVPSARENSSMSNRAVPTETYHPKAEVDKTVRTKTDDEKPKNEVKESRATRSK